MSIYLRPESSVGYALICASGVLALLVATHFYLSRKKDNLPPMVNLGIIQTVLVITSGKQAVVFFTEQVKKLGLVYRINLPEMADWIVVADYQLARRVFLDHDEKPYILQRFMGLTNGVKTIFTNRTHGNTWNSARKAVAPSFSVTNISKTLPRVHDKIDELQKILTQHVSDKTSFDVPRLMVLLTLDVICAAMFDTDLGTMQSTSSEGHALIDEYEIGLREYALKQMINPVRFLAFWDKDVRRAKSAARAIDTFQQGVLNKYREKNNASDIEEDNSILGHLLRSPYRSDTERCADMTTFLLAGHDTTSYSLAWTLIEVAKQPEIYQKIKKEIDSIVTTDEPITSQQVSEMHYLDSVIKESMRLWPVAALGSLREAREDITYNNYVIPKGSILQIPFYVLFRNGIKNPDLFDPDRWLPSNPEIDILKEMYIPFALGKRNCVGQTLAMLEIRLVLASVFKNFRFELISEVDMDYFLTLKPINAFMKVYKA